MMNAGAVQNQPAMVRIVELVKKVFFGMAYRGSAELPAMQRVAVLILILETAQMLAFPLHLDDAMPWDSEDAVRPLAQVLTYVSTVRMDATQSTAIFRALMGVALAWVYVFLGVAATVGFGHQKQQAVLQQNASAADDQGAMLVRSLWLMGYLSSNIFFLPIVNVLLRVLACPADHGGWMDAGYECTSPERLALTIFVFLSLLIFLGLTVTVTLAFVDRDPCSASWDARTSGRADVIMLSMKTLLAFLFNVVDGGLLGSAVLAIILVTAAAVWIGVYIVMAPYAHPHMQALSTGAGSVFFVASLSFFLVVVAPENDPTFLLYLGGAFAFFLGASVSLHWQMLVASKPLEELRDLNYIVMWARARLRKYAELNVTAVGRRGRPGASDSGAKDSGAKDRDGEEEELLRETREARDGGEGDGPASDETLSETLLHEAENGLRYAMEIFPRNEFAYVVASAFFRYHSTFHYQEAMALARARKLNPSLDTTFYIFQRTHQLRDSDTTGLSNLDRITFEQNLREVQRLRVEAYRHLVLVWETLSQHTPDLSQLRTVGLEFQRTIKTIDGLYQSLMRSSAESIAVLRSYAAFLIELANEPARATELLNRADRVEEVHSKQRNRTLRHIVFGARMAMQEGLDERSAVVTMSGDLSSMGEILTVTAAACRLFGYTASQLVGQNVAILTPPPIRSAHGGFLHRFANSSRAPKMLNHSVLVFGQAKMGHIFPMLLQVLEAPPEEETCAPRFTGIMQPIMTDEDHILFGSVDSGFRVFAASQRSLMFLGIEAETVAEENLSMLQWFPTLSPSFRSDRVSLSADQAQRMRSMPSMADILAEWMGEGGRHGGATTRRWAGAGGAGSGRSLLKVEDNDNSSVHGSVGGKPRAGKPSAGGGARAASDSEDDSETEESSDSGEDGETAVVAAGSGASDVGSHTHGARKSRSKLHTVRIGPLLRARKSSVIPVVGVADDTEVIVGSVQELKYHRTERFYLLRWRYLTGFVAANAATSAAAHDSLRSPESRRRSVLGTAAATAAAAAAAVTVARPAAAAEHAPKQEEAKPHDHHHHHHHHHRPHHREEKEEDDSPLGEAKVVPGGAMEEGSLGEADDALAAFMGDLDGDGGGKRKSASAAAAQAAAHTGDAERTTTYGVGETMVEVGMKTGSLILLDHGGGSGAVGLDSEASGDSDKAVSDSEGEEEDATEASPLHRPGAMQHDHVAFAPVTGPATNASSGNAMVSVQSASAVRGRTAFAEGAAIPGRQLAAPPGAGALRSSSVTRETQGDREERHTVGGGQSSVASTATKLGTQLRRAVASQESKTEREVNWARLVLVGIVGVILVMLIAVILWTDSLRTTVVDDSIALYDAGLRLIAFQGAIVRVRSLLAHNEGYIPLPDPDAEMERLRADVELFRTSHEAVFSVTAGSSSEVEEWDMNTMLPVLEVIMTEELLNETYRIGLGVGPAIPANRFLMPLTEYGQFVSAIMHHVSENNYTELVRTERNVANFLANRQMLRNAMNESVQIRQKEFTDSFPALESQLWIAGSLFFFVLVLVSGILFVNSVRSLGDRTKQVLELFMAVPEPLAKALKLRTTFLLNKAIASDTSGDGGEGFDDDEDENRVIIQEDMTGSEMDEQRLSMLTQSVARQQRMGRLITRPHDDRSRYVVINVTKLLLPIMALTGWIAFLLIFLNQVNSQAQDTSQRMIKFQESHSLIVDVMDNTWRAMECRDPVERADLIARIVERDRQVLARTKLAIFGGTTVTSAGVEIDLNALHSWRRSYKTLFGNACLESPYEQCPTIEDGVMTKGLYAATMANLALIRSLIATFPNPDPGGHLLTPERLELYEHAINLESPHVGFGFRSVASTLAEDQRSEFDAGIDLAVNISIIFVVCFIVLSAMFYLPVISGLAVPLQSARSLLTVLPDDIILTLPELRRLIQGVVIETQLGYRAKVTTNEDDKGEKTGCCGARKSVPASELRRHSGLNVESLLEAEAGIVDHGTQSSRDAPEVPASAPASAAVGVASRPAFAASLGLKIPQQPPV